LSSDRAQLVDEFGLGPLRILSRVSSGTRDFGRQAPFEDDDSPVRCWDGRSFSLREGLGRFFSTVRQLSDFSEFSSVRRSDDDGEVITRLSSRDFGFHESFDAPLSSKCRSVPRGRQLSFVSTRDGSLSSFVRGLRRHGAPSVRSFS
jgi:hypothetical protein